MIYEFIFEFEKSEKYDINEIIFNLDYTISNPKEMFDKSFERVQQEKVKKYVNEVIDIFKKSNIDFEYKIVKVLPKYLTEGIDKIPFKVIFQIKFQKDIKDKKFIKNTETEFALLKDEVTGIKKLINSISPNKIFYKKI